MILLVNWNIQRGKGIFKNSFYNKAHWPTFKIRLSEELLSTVMLLLPEYVSNNSV